MGPDGTPSAAFGPPIITIAPSGLSRFPATHSIGQKLFLVLTHRLTHLNAESEVSPTVLLSSPKPHCKYPWESVTLIACGHVSETGRPQVCVCNTLQRIYMLLANASIRKPVRLHQFQIQSLGRTTEDGQSSLPCVPACPLAISESNVCTHQIPQHSRWEGQSHQ